MTLNTGNGWNEYRRQVMADLNRLEGKVDLVDEKLDRMHNDFVQRLVALETRSAIIGGIAGVVTGGLIAALVALVVP